MWAGVWSAPVYGQGDVSHQAFLLFSPLPILTTILPRAAHCLRYSTRKKVSNMSIPSVGCTVQCNSLIKECNTLEDGTWSRMTISVSSWR